MDEEKDKFTEREVKLIKYIRDIEHGEIRIIVQNKQPIRIEEMKRSILI